MSINAVGQIEKPITKGNLLTGGSFSFDNEKYKRTEEDGGVEYKYYDDRFKSDFYTGYFVLKHFTIGLKVDYQIRRRKNTPDYDVIFFDYLTLNPFFRYYLSFGVFGEGSIGFGFDKWHFEESRGEKNIFNWDVGIGYSLFLNRNIALEPKVSYSYRRRTETYLPEEVEEFMNLNFKIGLQFYFSLNKKKNSNE